VCSVEWVGVDLANRDARRDFFDRIWTTAPNGAGASISGSSVRNPNAPSTRSALATRQS